MRVRNDGNCVFVFDMAFTVEEAFRLARLIHGNAMECNREVYDRTWALSKLEELSMNTSDELQGRVQEVYMWLRQQRGAVDQANVNMLDGQDQGGEGDRGEAGKEDQAVRDGAQRDAPVT